MNNCKQPISERPWFKEFKKQLSQMEGVITVLPLKRCKDRSIGGSADASS